MAERVRRIILTQLPILWIFGLTAQGKISNYGKSYCCATQLTCNGCEYIVEANDKLKSTMFYVHQVQGGSK